MEYTTLGRSDLKVSRVCLGTMTFGTQNSEADAAGAGLCRFAQFCRQHHHRGNHH